MTWDSFIFFAIPALLLWAGGAWTAWKSVRYRPIFSLLRDYSFTSPSSSGCGCRWSARPFARWVRPACGTPSSSLRRGLIVYSRWRYPWILAFSTILAGVFTTINIVNPEIHNKTLMPALQSPWFAPHVIVYMFAYAVLGAAALMSAYLLWFKKSPINDHEMDICDNLVQVGWAFMTVGILFGALWAKEAWGHYWAWDPKETWAAATWFAYLAYIHVRIRSDRYRRAALWGLFISFILLQMCWWGINYLPSAQGASVHTYSLG